MNGETSRKSAAALPPEIRALLANLWLGIAEPRCLVDWATDQLVAGQDSPHLRILAGLNGNDREEIQAFFAKALTDLGIPLPDREQCLIYRCGDVARDILKGAISPLTAFNLLGQITMEVKYPAVLRCWTQLETDLEAMDDAEVPVAEREGAVRDACKHFLPLLEDYTGTGVARFSMERSLEALRARGWRSEERRV